MGPVKCQRGDSYCPINSEIPRFLDPESYCVSKSPGERVKNKMPRLHPRPIKQESPVQNLRTSYGLSRPSGFEVVLELL